MIFYFDTSIWLDIYEKRGKNGKQAFNLLKKIIEEDHELAFSDLNINELKHLGYDSLILKTAKFKKHVHIYSKQILEARKISRRRKVPLKDALHAIITRDNDLQLIATDRHFEMLNDITKSKKPIDFI